MNKLRIGLAALVLAACATPPGTEVNSSDDLADNVSYVNLYVDPATVISRFTDEEAGVVCYSVSGNGKALSCLPISQTELEE